MAGPGDRVKATARVEVARRCGRDVLVDVFSEPPIAIRATPGRVHLVGSAAAPVGGDELALDLVVGPGSRLAVGSVAATVAWPGSDGAPSTQTMRAHVGAGAHLTWAPEPLVAVDGCHHRSRTHVELAGDATAWLVDEIALGRSAEPAGDAELEWRIQRCGRVVVHHTERFGPWAPGAGSVAAGGRFRHVVVVLAVGLAIDGNGEGDTLVGPTLCAARLILDADAMMLLAAATDRPTALRALARWCSTPPR